MVKNLGERASEFQGFAEVEKFELSLNLRLVLDRMVENGTKDTYGLVPSQPKDTRHPSPPISIA